jgi:hypothetical protein
MEYVAPMILDGKSISHLTVKANIKNKLNITLASVPQNLIQNYSCSFSPTGAIALDEKTLEPKHLKVDFEACKTDLIQTWASEQMVAGALNNELPKTFEAFLLDTIKKEVNLEIDETIWLGDEAGSGGIYAAKPYLTKFNGFLKLAKADANTIKVTKTAITPANVIAELTKVYNAIPDTIFDNPDLKFFVSRDVYRAYGVAQDSYIAGNSAYTINNSINYAFKGIELIPTNMGTGNMFVAMKSNLHFGTDLESDLQSYKMIDFEVVGSDKVGVIMKFLAGVQYAIAPEVVVYA